MKPHYLLILVIIISDIVYGFKPNNAIQKQSKSIFFDKKYSKKITPARYNAENHIKYDNSVTDNFMPEHYFPEVEYPINILEASKPFYVITGENNALLTPVTNDLITNCNSAPIKPPMKKRNTDILGENKLKTWAVKNMTYKTTGQDIFYSIDTNNQTTAHENNVKDIFGKALIDLPTGQVVSQQAISTDKEYGVQIEKMTIPLDSQEYYDYEDLGYETDYSKENYTSIDDEVEVFNVDGVFSDTTFENNTPEEATNYYSKNSTIESREETLNSTILIEPNTCPLNVCPLPLEKNCTNLNSVQKAHKRIGLGPVQKVKQRKFLKHMNKSL